MLTSSKYHRSRSVSSSPTDLVRAGAGKHGTRAATGLLVGGLLIAGALLAGAVGAHTTHPCPCRYPGGVAASGAVVCLEVGGKRSLARCEMVLNNSSWRFLDRPCPIASPTTPARPVG